MLGFEYTCVHLTLTKYLPILFYGLQSVPINYSVLQSLTKFWNTVFNEYLGYKNMI